MPDSSTILAAVQAASEDPSTQEVSQETKVEETPVVENKPEEKSEEEQETKLDARTTQALNLLAQLEDPETAPEIIKLLAKNIGLIQDAETPREVIKASKTIREKVMAKLGEDYPLLANSVGDLLEEIVGEQEAKFAKEINTREAARYQAEIESRVSKFIADNKVTEAEQAAIKELSKEFPPHPSVPPERYLGQHLKTIRLEQAEAQRNKTTKDKVKNNLSERPANRGAEGNEERMRKAQAHLTPLQAVQMALRGETLE